MADQSIPTNVVDLDPRRIGFALHRVQAALEGRFDASLLRDDEAVLFEDLLWDAMDGTHTAEARTFWAGFEGQPNTDL